MNIVFALLLSLLLSYPVSTPVSEDTYVYRTYSLSDYEGIWSSPETTLIIEIDGFKMYIYDSVSGSEMFSGPAELVEHLSDSRVCIITADFCGFDRISVTGADSLSAESSGTTLVFTREYSTPYVEPSVVCYKPVIYLYPKDTTEVTVELQHAELTCTYPNYDECWHMTAYPDGTLTDNSGFAYNYLYWEGKTSFVPDFSEGFCVSGSNTASFLEEALTSLGLTRREANEFIVFWLPLMQNNNYNIISFQGADYDNAVPLSVSPLPDTVIRVFMAWYASDTQVSIAPQSFAPVTREGFTVVEWGGTEIE